MRTFPPDTLPPCCDFPVCLCHIIAAASVAAITHFVAEPGFIAVRALPQLACGTEKHLPGADWVGGDEVLTLVGDYLTQSVLLASRYSLMCCSVNHHSGRTGERAGVIISTAKNQTAGMIARSISAICYLIKYAKRSPGFKSSLL